MHFESRAREYATSRPPYPTALFELLKAVGVIGPGTRVLEVGAGSGMATREVVKAGSSVVAIEPGRDLARVLAQDHEGVSVIVATLEDAVLPTHSFDSVVAATSMHWVELSTSLPKLHAALRKGGRLAVWRHQFSDDSVASEFRRRVQEIADARSVRASVRDRPNTSTVEELTAGGWFEPVRTEYWRWSIELDTDKVRSLFRSFPGWTDAEIEAVSQAVVEDLGGIVTEHYQTVLHLLRRAADR
jgi:protein-L-isoaspartate O-methyltransferase